MKAENALGQAMYIVSGTGTPFRTDNRRIPFLRYSHDGKLERDYNYSYGQAVRDGYCREICFRWFDCHADNMLEDDDIIRMSDPDIDHHRRRNLLHAALDPFREWLPEVLESAHRELMAIRQSQQSNAGGIIACKNTDHADEVAKVLAQITGEMPVVVHDKLRDVDASSLIDGFRKSSDKWIVAVQMVSEGTDIKRLRVGVWLTNRQSKLMSYQLTTRCGRRIYPHNRNDTYAVWYLPDTPVMRDFADILKADVICDIDPLDDEGIEAYREYASRMWDDLLDNLEVGDDGSLVGHTPDETLALTDMINDAGWTDMEELLEAADAHGVDTLDLLRLRAVPNGLTYQGETYAADITDQAITHLKSVGHPVTPENIVLIISLIQQGTIPVSQAVAANVKQDAHAELRAKLDDAVKKLVFDCQEHGGVRLNGSRIDFSSMGLIWRAIKKPLGLTNTKLDHFTLDDLRKAYRHVKTLQAQVEGMRGAQCKR
jgi:hypothetical protein